jgi:hypothetical protein
VGVALASEIALHDIEFVTVGIEHRGVDPRPRLEDLRDRLGLRDGDGEAVRLEDVCHTTRKRRFSEGHATDDDVEITAHRTGPATTLAVRQDRTDTRAASQVVLGEQIGPLLVVEASSILVVETQ